MWFVTVENIHSCSIPQNYSILCLSRQQLAWRRLNLCMSRNLLHVSLPWTCEHWYVPLSVLWVNSVYWTHSVMATNTILRKYYFHFHPDAVRNTHCFKLPSWSGASQPSVYTHLQTSALELFQLPLGQGEWSNPFKKQTKSKATLLTKHVHSIPLSVKYSSSLELAFVQLLVVASHSHPSWSLLLFPARYFTDSTVSLFKWWFNPWGIILKFPLECHSQWWGITKVDLYCILNYPAEACG